MANKLFNNFYVGTIEKFNSIEKTPDALYFITGVNGGIFRGDKKIFGQFVVSELKPTVPEAGVIYYIEKFKDVETEEGRNYFGYFNGTEWVAILDQSDVDDIKADIDAIEEQIANMDLEDEAVEGQVVKSVTQEDGQIAVVRDFLKDTDIKVVDAELTDANVLESFKLVNGDGEQLGETIKIYKDRALKDVKFEDQKLIFTYEIADGTDKDVTVDVSAFLHESEYGKGLEVVDHVVSVKSANEKHIVSDENGVGLGVNAVVYQEFTYKGEERRTIQLNNFDTISGIGADCREGQPNGYEGGEDLRNEGFDLVMLSKRNVADFGSTKVHMNLNSKGGLVTINDDEVIATLSDLQSAKVDVKPADGSYLVIEKAEGATESEKDVYTIGTTLSVFTAGADNGEGTLTSGLVDDATMKAYVEDNAIYWKEL